MVTKRQLLSKFKVIELKKIAKDKGLEVKGSKSDYLDALSEILEKDDIFQLNTEMLVEKPSFDLSEHTFVPKHEIMAQDEVQELLVRYNCTKQQLPKIKFNDPIIKMIGAKPGDVIRVLRKSATAGAAVYYRVVV